MFFSKNDVTDKATIAYQLKGWVALPTGLAETGEHHGKCYIFLYN